MQAGHLADNVMHFGRVLRHAGLPVGSDRIALALQALQATGLEDRESLRAVLAATLLDRHASRPMFDQAFDLFWRDPDFEGHMHRLLLPRVDVPRSPRPGLSENRRLAEALFPTAPTPPAPPQDAQTMTVTWTANAREVLQRADFATMSTDEWRQAAQALAALRWLFEPLPSRRRRAAPEGAGARLDFRRTLQASARQGGEGVWPRWSQPAVRPAPVLMLVDISGSMSRYSRVALHLAHALARGGPLECFVFGTRLTRITRWLRDRDPDHALSQIENAVRDWSGGTRIGENLHAFHREWAGRTLSGRSTVLLISDGLETGDPQTLREGLGAEMARLRRRCRRLLWLNPLLRYDAFAPVAGGIRTMLPHVDALLPVHNLDSLKALAQTLGQGPQGPQGPRPRPFSSPVTPPITPP